VLARGVLLRLVRHVAAELNVVLKGLQYSLDCKLGAM
jgi:hypothetical protein